MSTMSRGKTIQTIRGEHSGGTQKAEINRAAISRRTFLRWAAGAAGMATLGAFLPGCGPSVSAPTPTPTVAAKPQGLIMGSAVDIYTLDPAVGFDTAIGSSLKTFYDALFRHVGNPPRVIPWLAESYEVSQDATEWTFKLVKNAKFHDGSPVTATAVKYSAERLLRIGGGAASLFTGILGPESVSLLGDYELKIKLLQPFGPFLDTLPWLFVINPDLAKANAGNDDGQTWLKDHEAGSGPFTMGEWKPGERYEFKAVPNYWKGWPAEGHVESYERRVIQDAAARVRALEQGEVHIIDWASPEEQIRLKQNGFFVVDQPTIMTYDIKLNNQEGYTADPHVRKAISYAFDYEALQKIWASRAPLLEGPLSPSLEWAAKDLKIYRLDLEKAKAELAQSSQPQGGFDLDFVYVTGLEEERKTGEILRDQLAKLNIKVNIVPMAWADAVGTFKNPKTSPAMFPLYSSTAYSDPDNFLWSAFHSSLAGEWTNPGHYKNPAMDDLLKQGRATVDQARRKELYHQAQQLVLDDAANVFGVSNPDFHVYSQKVQGLVFCPVMGSEQDFYSLRLQS